ncbi:MAG: HD domain-containing protein [Lactobacillus sp.]|nr:HD domain-containing protein [Lactobacillus sp.]
MTTAERIIEFYKIIEKLCLVKRSNWLSNGDSESDSDHVFKVAFLTLMISPYLQKKVDYTKLLELALVHDSVEAIAGDVDMAAHLTDSDIKKQKKQKEAEAIEHYKSILPPPLNEKIYNLFMEYEDRQTYESKVLKCIDTLDACLQCYLYKGGDVSYWKDAYPYSKWHYENSLTKKEHIQNLGEDILLNIEDCKNEELKSIYEKCGIELYNYIPSGKPLNETAQKITAFYKIIEKLCMIRRDNLLQNFEDESDSDHILKLSFLVMLTAPYFKSKVDYTRMLEIALVHDIAEATVGDFPLASQTADVKKIKKQKEQETIEYYKSILPEPLNQKIYDLFQEYENRQTLEAKIVYGLDKLDAALQMNSCGDLDYVTKLPNGLWYFNYAITKREILKEVDEEILYELEDLIIELTKTNVAKLNLTAAE